MIFTNVGQERRRPRRIPGPGVMSFDFFSGKLHKGWERRSPRQQKKDPVVVTSTK